LIGKKILEFLKKEDCPLKESLEICEKYQIKKAIVFLLPRTGKIEQALDLHLKVLFNFFI